MLNAHLLYDERIYLPCIACLWEFDIIVAGLCGFELKYRIQQLAILRANATNIFQVSRYCYGVSIDCLPEVIKMPAAANAADYIEIDRLIYKSRIRA